jgi:hypothetical protein
MIKKVVKKIGKLIETRNRKSETKSVLLELESDKNEVIKNLVGTFKFINFNKNWTDSEIESLNQVNEIR